MCLVLSAVIVLYLSVSFIFCWLLLRLCLIYLIVGSFYLCCYITAVVLRFVWVALILCSNTCLYWLFLRVCWVVLLVCFVVEIDVGFAFVGLCWCVVVGLFICCFCVEFCCLLRFRFVFTGIRFDCWLRLWVVIRGNAGFRCYFVCFGLWFVLVLIIRFVGYSYTWCFLLLLYLTDVGLFRMDFGFGLTFICFAFIVCC